VLSSVEFPIDKLDIGRWLIQVQAWVVLPFKVLRKSVPDRAELVALEQLSMLNVPIKLGHGLWKEEWPESG
jgi:hypothetical protein